MANIATGVSLVIPSHLLCDSHVALSYVSGVLILISVIKKSTQRADVNIAYPMKP